MNLEFIFALIWTFFGIFDLILFIFLNKIEKKFEKDNHILLLNIFLTLKNIEKSLKNGDKK